MGAFGVDSFGDSLPPNARRKLVSVAVLRMASPKVPQEQAADIVLPLTYITAIELPKKRFSISFSARLLLYFTLRYRLGDEEKSLLLGVDPKTELFTKLLAIFPVSKRP